MEMTTISIQAPRQLFFDLADLARSLGKDKKTIQAWVKEGRFPPPITLGAGKVWSNTAIGVWLAWTQVCPAVSPSKHDENVGVEE